MRRLRPLLFLSETTVARYIPVKSGIFSQKYLFQLLLTISGDSLDSSNILSSLNTKEAGLLWNFQAKKKIPTIVVTILMSDCCKFKGRRNYKIIYMLTCLSYKYYIFFIFQL